MSAYATLRGNSSNSTNIEEDDVEEIIKYQSNSSDNESDDDKDQQFESLRQQAEEIHSNSQTPGNLNDTRPVISLSNFYPTCSNIRYFRSSIEFKLTSNQYILIRGQFKFKVISGSIKLNNFHIISESDAYHDMNNLGQSVPMIQNHSITGSSTILISDLINGIEKIVKLPNPTKTYSFQLSSGVNALYIDDKWIELLENLTYKSQQIINTSPNMRKRRTFMVIGNKNTGKSTFAKTLLNSIIENYNMPVVYLDLDPGQSEYNQPLNLSMTKVENVNYGSHSFNYTESQTTKYYGFNNPVSLINRYESIVENFDKLFNDQYPMIINTPGYIKGYGKELLTKITNKFQPDNLILLSNKLDINANENKEVVENLQYENLNIIPGVYQSVKNSIQMRDLSKLLYFHQKTPCEFDFRHYLIDKSPLKLSYSTNENKGYIKSFTILNHSSTDLDMKELPFMIEAQIWAIYKTKNSINVVSNSKSPNYLNPEEFEFTNGYLGLIIIHSVNMKEKYVNMYTPNHVVEKIQDAVIDGYSLVCCRGGNSDSEVPNYEMLYPNFLKLKQNAIKNGNGNNFDLPYINFEKNLKIGGIWKPRRNLMRRSHQR
ncbi:unnamed protein product [Candida verbasci]|uniref:Polynucleotide 5'-hydroxyl-kinase GRC3 n=1 Tax=Candida verbasci TaxID=1227364 RepID=A0A9W4X8C2_9ASCO|nr:unnamed protein product [Candida verbasci]